MSFVSGTGMLNFFFSIFSLISFMFSSLFIKLCTFSCSLLSKLFIDNFSLLGLFSIDPMILSLLLFNSRFVSWIILDSFIISLSSNFFTDSPAFVIFFLIPSIIDLYSFFISSFILISVIHLSTESRIFLASLSLLWSSFFILMISFVFSLILSFLWISSSFILLYNSVSLLVIFSSSVILTKLSNSPKLNSWFIEYFSLKKSLAIASNCERDSLGVNELIFDSKSLIFVKNIFRISFWFFFSDSSFSSFGFSSFLTSSFSFLTSFFFEVKVSFMNNPKKNSNTRNMSPIGNKVRMETSAPNRFNDWAFAISIFRSIVSTRIIPLFMELAGFYYYKNVS